MSAVLHILLLACSVWLAVTQDVPQGPCALNQCQNAGSCVVNSTALNGFICLCVPGSTGALCQYLSCSDPGSPSNGQHSPSGSSFVHGTVVTFSCNSGYTLVGNSSASCDNGAWNASSPMCQNFCDNAVCPRDTDPRNSTWTSCCSFLGKSVQCCRPGVQAVLNDRYRNITSPQCVRDLQQPSVFAGCIGDLVTCLSLQKNKTFFGCSDIHGCEGVRGSLANCRNTLGSGAMLCNSTIIQGSGLTELTSFCLPPTCSTSLDGLAQSDFLINCDILTKLGGAPSCPIVRVNINCPGGNGTFDVGGNPIPPGGGDDGGSLSGGTIAGIIIGVLLCLALLIVVVIFFYKQKAKSPDTIDFAQLEEEVEDE